MDVQTMAVMVGLTNALLAVLLLVQHRANRVYSGPGWWAIGQTIVAVGLMLGNLRGTSGLTKLAIPLWQTTVVAGFVLVYVGLESFFGRRVRITPLAVVVIALLIWSTVFTFGFSSLGVRSVGLYLSLTVVLAMMARSVWRYRQPDVPRARHYLIVVFAATSVLYFALALGAALGREDPDALYAPSPIKTVGYLGALACTILWVFGLEFLLNERLQAKVATEADNMQRVFTASPDCAILSRLDNGVITDVNEGFTRVTGYPRTEAIGRSSLDIELWHSTDDRRILVDLLCRVGECENLPAVLRRRDGTLIDCLVSARTIHLGPDPHLISITRDVTEQRRLEAQLQREATTDSLTGVANRRHFMSIADQHLREAAGRTQRTTLAIVDVDEFKDINDTLGHAAGDAALCHFTEVAQRVLGGSGVIGRLGGDEFAFLLPETPMAQALAQVRATASSLDVMFEGKSIPLTVSAGVAEVASEHDTVDDLIARADIALYEAKATGRNRVVAAEPSG